MSQKYNWVDLAVSTVNYLVLQYLLDCALLSLRSSPLFILFFASSCYLLARYAEELHRLVGSKWVRYILLVAVLLLNFALVAVFGYLPIGPAPKFL